MSRLKFIVLTLVMAAMLTGCYNSTSTKKMCLCQATWVPEIQTP